MSVQLQEGHSHVRLTGIFSAFEALLPMARKGILPLIGNGLARTNSIDPQDVAELVVKCFSSGPADLPCGFGGQTQVALHPLRGDGRWPITALLARLAVQANRVLFPVRFLILASSSAGNSAFISDGVTHLLVDCGLSRKETFARLEANGIDPCCIDAILVTHEHCDHVSGLGPIAKKLAKPVYLTQATADSLEAGKEAMHFQPFQAGSKLAIGSFEVQSFSLPHDAEDPVGYTFSSNGRKVGVCTDLGYMPDSIRYHLQDCDILLLESNHDLEMLKVGPYPWSLKQRVMSRRGHLSNDVVSQFILDDLSPRTRKLVLGHLSEQNNLPALAHMVAAQAIDRRGLSNIDLTVSEPRQQSSFFEI